MTHSKPSNMERSLGKFTYFNDSILNVNDKTISKRDTDTE